MTTPPRAKNILFFKCRPRAPARARRSGEAGDARACCSRPCPPPPPPWSLFCDNFPSVFTNSFISGWMAFSYRITKRCGSCRPLNVPSEETRGGDNKKRCHLDQSSLFYYILFYLKSILRKTVLCQGGCRFFSITRTKVGLYVQCLQRIRAP